MGCSESKEVAYDHSGPPVRMETSAQQSFHSRPNVQASTPANRQQAVLHRPTQPPVTVTNRVADSTTPRIWQKRIAQDDMDFVVNIWHHPMSDPQGRFECWTFISEGISKVNEHEIVFTVRQQRNESDENYPATPIEWMRLVCTAAREGVHVEDGQLCTIIFQEFVLINIGRRAFRLEPTVWKEMRNFGSFVHGLPRLACAYASLPQGAVQPESRHVIGLTTEETAVAREFGTTRVVAQIGLALRWFPFPPWIDRDRGDYCTMVDQTGSIRSCFAIARIYGISAIRTEDETVLTIQNRIATREAFQASVRDAAANMPLGFESFMTEDADAGLVWKHGQPQNRMVAYGGRPNMIDRLCFAFLIICPNPSGEDASILIEDGYSLFLSNNSLHRLKQAIENGRDIVIPMEQDMRFRLEWECPETSKSSQARLVQIRYDVKPHPRDIDSTALGKFINKVCAELVKLVPIRTSGDAMPVQLSVKFDLLGWQSRFEIRSSVILSKLLSFPRIRSAIQAIPSPKAKKPATFELVFILWEPESG